VRITVTPSAESWPASFAILVQRAAWPLHPGTSFSHDRCPRMRHRQPPACHRSEISWCPLTTRLAVRMSCCVSVSRSFARVRFEQAGPHLTAVEIVRDTRLPIIPSLHRTLVALGLVVSSYQARTGPLELVERVVFEPRDGGKMEAGLGEAAKAAILELV